MLLKLCLNYMLLKHNFYISSTLGTYVYLYYICNVHVSSYYDYRFP